MEFSAFVNLDTDDIAKEIAGQFTSEELVEFIRSIDLYASDWHFSEEMYKYFKKEHKFYKAEVTGY